MLLVDGMNLIGSRPDGWWKDRTEAMRLMAWELRAFAEDTGEELTVVFDGRPIGSVLRGHGIEVQFAPGGDERRRSAHRAARLRSRAPGRDHGRDLRQGALASAVVAAGASVIGSGEFRARLEELDGNRPG